MITLERGEEVKLTYGRYYAILASERDQKDRAKAFTGLQFHAAVEPQSVCPIWLRWRSIPVNGCGRSTPDRSDYWLRFCPAYWSYLVWACSTTFLA